MKYTGLNDIESKHKGLIKFIIFVASFVFSIGFAQNRCDSYDTYKFVEENAEHIVTNNLNYWMPRNLSSDVVDCHYFENDGITEVSVYTDWIAYNNNDVFQMIVRFTIYPNGSAYWEITKMNDALSQHDLTMNFLELMYEMASQ